MSQPLLPSFPTGATENGAESEGTKLRIWSVYGEDQQKSRRGMPPTPKREEQSTDSVEYETKHAKDRVPYKAPRRPHRQTGERDPLGWLVEDPWEPIGKLAPLPTEAPKNPDPEVVEFTIPSVTVTDIARFAPKRTRLLLEPGEFTITGMPTNIVVTPEKHVQTGTLFGLTARVEFTPVEYTIHYGDGTSLITREAGETWEQLSAAQFDRTATSHSYARAGRYVVHADISYEASVLFPQHDNWQDVPGIVTERIPSQQVQALDSQTALVAHNCVDEPHAKGC